MMAEGRPIAPARDWESTPGALGEVVDERQQPCLARARGAGRPARKIRPSAGKDPYLPFAGISKHAMAADLSPCAACDQCGARGAQTGGPRAEQAYGLVLARGISGAVAQKNP